MRERERERLLLFHGFNTTYKTRRETLSHMVSVDLYRVPRCLGTLLINVVIEMTRFDCKRNVCD